MTDENEPKQYANHVIPNSFQTPNIYVDLLLELLTDSELRVLIFATRHILGWREKIKLRKGIISLEMFVGGYGPYPGCGLNKQTVIKTCKSLVTFKVLEKDGVTRNGTRWHLVEDFDDIDIQALETRHANKKSSDKKRTETMLNRLEAKRLKLLCDNTPPVLCDNTESNPPSNPSLNPKDSPQQKNAAEQSSDLDDGNLYVMLCKGCGGYKQHSGLDSGACDDCIDSGHDGPIDLPHYLPGVEWVKDIWQDNDALPNMCAGCSGRFEDGNTYYYQGNYSNRLCPGCYLEQCDGGHDEPPDNLEQLTNGETNVLEFLTRRENGAMHDDVYTHAKCTTNTIHRLQSRLYIEPVVFDDMLMLAITDTGRAALEAHKAQEANMQRWQQASDNGQIRERTFDDGCDKCGGKVRAGSDAKCTECGHFNSGLAIDSTMQKNDNAKQLTAEQSSGPECFESQPITPKAKKPRKASADTLMKNALVTAMGFKREDVTCWGEYQSASKKLRAAKFPVEDIPALYTFSRTLAKHCNYKFKSPMQLAKDLPDFRKAQRKIKQHTPPPFEPTPKPKAKKPRKAKAKRTPEQRQVDDDMFEAVKFAWKINDNGSYKIIKFQQFFLGVVKSSSRYGKIQHIFDYQLTECPADGHEVAAWALWYRDQYPDTPLPENGEKLRSQFESFRGSDKWQQFMQRAAKVIEGKELKISLSGSTPGTEPATKPEIEVEEELIEMTPERIKQMNDAMDSIGHGGVK